MPLEARKLNEALRHNLRTLMKSVNTPRPMHKPGVGHDGTTNYFDQLKENIQEIKTTHYSPAKLGLRQSIPDLTPTPRRSGPEKVKPPKHANFAPETGGVQPQREPRREEIEAQLEKLQVEDEDGPVSTSQLTAPKEPKPELLLGARKHLLVARVDAQNKRILQLERELRELHAANRQLHEMNLSVQSQLEEQERRFEREEKRRQQKNRERYFQQLVGSEHNAHVQVPESDFAKNQHNRQSRKLPIGVDHNQSGPSAHSDYHKYLHRDDEVGPDWQFPAGPTDIERRQAKSSKSQVESRNSPRVPPDSLPSLAGQVAHYKLLYTEACERLRASVEISEFQRKTIDRLARPARSGNSAFLDDDTTSLILGHIPDHDSTAALISGNSSRNAYTQAFPAHCTARTRLRAAIWAVVFIHRIRARTIEHTEG